MSFVSNTIDDAIYDWVFGTSAKTTLWLYLNAPRPTLPYISLNKTNFSKIGWDYETPPDDEGRAALFGNREFLLEINYYGTGGLDVFEKLTTSLQSEPVIQALADKGVVFIDKVMQNNIAELMDTTFEERHIMELKFRCSNQGITDPDTFATGLIQTVEVGGTTSGGVISPKETEQDIGVPYEPPP